MENIFIYNKNTVEPLKGISTLGLEGQASSSERADSTGPERARGGSERQSGHGGVLEPRCSSPLLPPEATNKRASNRQAETFSATLISPTNPTVKDHTGPVRSQVRPFYLWVKIFSNK